MNAQVVATLGVGPPWAVKASRRVRRKYGTPPLDRRDELARFLLADDEFARRLHEIGGIPLIKRWWIYQPAVVAGRWEVPVIATLGELQSWLGAEGPALEWLADAKGLERFAADERLRNYRYRWLPKRRGGWRLIESPKEQLRAIQHRILHGILDRIPPHESAHGFRRGRSVRTFALPHVGRPIVWRLDLQEFFGSVTIGRVYGIFRAAGYPEAVARALAALCTNRPPLGLPRDEPLTFGEKQRLRMPHLPQGAPTSPALANLCAHGLDVRLTALASCADATYTRYADDLAFSFHESTDAARFIDLAAGVCLDEGFAVNFRKVREMKSSSRQELAGVVVNATTNVDRREFDALKAIVHNCVRQGPSTQAPSDPSGFRAHLLGRISWVAMLNPLRGARLRAGFEEIDWSR